MTSEMPNYGAIGEYLMDGKVLDEQHIEWGPGGAPANVIYGISQLSERTARTGLISSVGMDYYGDSLIKILQKAGINTSQIFQREEVPTTLAYIYPEQDGQKKIIFARAADKILLPSELDPNFFRDMFFFHYGSLSMTEQGPYETTFEAIRLAQNNEAIVSFDPNYRQSFWGNDRTYLAGKRIWEGIEKANIVKTSDQDVPFITGTDDIELSAQHILDKSPAEIVVITMGEKGCYYLTRSGMSDVIPAFKINFVESTGAGDAFTASMIYDVSLLIPQKRKLNEITQDEWNRIITNGNASGAIVASRKGTMDAMPSLSERDNFVSSAKKIQI